MRSAISDQQYVGWEYGQCAVVATLDIQSNEVNVLYSEILNINITAFCRMILIRDMWLGKNLLN